MFALDTSESVTKDDFESMKTFVSAITRRLDIESGKMRVGMILYSDDGLPQFHIDTFKHAGDIVDEIRRAPYITGDSDPADTMRQKTHTH